MTPQRYQKLKQTLLRRQADLTIVMENVHKPHNLAAIARTSDAVGISEIHAITHFDSIQLSQGIASGSAKWVNVRIHKDINAVCEELRKNKFQILSAHFSAEALDFRQVDYTIPTAIIFGQELEGITMEAVRLADKNIIIPMHGMVQSLNVSVATAVILYEAQRQRQQKKLYDHQHLDDQTINNIIFEKGYPRLAKKYRDQRKPYPQLNKNGEIEN